MNRNEPITVAAARLVQEISRLLRTLGWKLIGLGMEMSYKAEETIHEYAIEPYRLSILYSLEIGGLNRAEAMYAWSYLVGLAEEIRPESPQDVYQAVASGLAGEYELLDTWGISMRGIDAAVLPDEAQRIRFRWNRIVSEMKPLAGRDS